MHLGLPAFARLLKARPDARLTMIGHGSAKARWQKLAERLGIAANIDWQPWLPRAELAKFYVSHQVMLFPSLHDTGGMVVLESLAYGLPVVCLNIGGPGIIVTRDCGRVIDVAGKSKTEVAKLGQALIDLTNEDMRLRLVAGAGPRCRDFYWQKKVAGFTARRCDVIAGYQSTHHALRTRRIHNVELQLHAIAGGHPAS
jgi:glycosyltransferase involved in cell wall biosynthesis